MTSEYLAVRCLTTFFFVQEIFLFVYPYNHVLRDTTDVRGKVNEGGKKAHCVINVSIKFCNGITIVV